MSLGIIVRLFLIKCPLVTVRLHLGGCCIFTASAFGRNMCLSSFPVGPLRRDSPLQHQSSSYLILQNKPITRRGRFWFIRERHDYAKICFLLLSYFVMKRELFIWNATKGANEGNPSKLHKTNREEKKSFGFDFRKQSLFYMMFSAYKYFPIIEKLEYTEVGWRPRYEDLSQKTPRFHRSVVTTQCANMHFKIAPISHTHLPSCQERLRWGLDLASGDSFGALKWNTIFHFRFGKWKGLCLCGFWL